MCENERFTRDYIDETINKYKNANRNHLEWLRYLIDENNNDMSDDERIILLGCIFYGSNQYQAFFIEEQNNFFFNCVKEFCKSVIFLKSNVNSIYDKLTPFLSKIKLKDIDYKNNLLFIDNNLKYASKIKSNVIDSKMNDETKMVIYKYIYSIFFNAYGKKDKDIFLPIIIFQSVFHKTDDLLRKINHSFKLIKTEDISETDNIIIKHIKKKETIIKKNDNDDYQNEWKLELNSLFYFNNFDAIKLKNGFNAKEWLFFFFEICNLVYEYNKNNDIFKLNFIAFLLLSDIFDLTFINDEYDSHNPNNENTLANISHFNFNNFFKIPEFFALNWYISPICGEGTIADQKLNYRKPENPQVSRYNFPQKSILNTININRFIEINYKIDDAYAFYDYKSRYIKQVEDYISIENLLGDDYKLKDIPGCYDKEKEAKRIIENNFNFYFNKLIKKDVFNFLLDFTGIKKLRKNLSSSKTDKKSIPL